MADWKTRVEKILPDEPPLTDEQEDAFLELLNERLDESRLRGLVWKSMNYSCERCGNNHRYELEVGVEGPPEWREDQTFLACAFSAGRCELCGGTMTHVRFQEDETFSPRKPSAKWVFRVPRAAVVYPTRGMDEDGYVIHDRSRSAFLAFNLHGS